MKTLGDYDVWYQPCEKCGYDTGKSTIPKDGNQTCWKCGNYVKRDYSERALKKKVLTFNLVEDHEEGITFGYYIEYSNGTKKDISKKKFKRLYKVYGRLYGIPTEPDTEDLYCKKSILENKVIDLKEEILNIRLRVISINEEIAEQMKNDIG